MLSFVVLFNGYLYLHLCFSHASGFANSLNFIVVIIIMVVAILMTFSFISSLSRNSLVSFHIYTGVLFRSFPNCLSCRLFRSVSRFVRAHVQRFPCLTLLRVAVCYEAMMTHTPAITSLATTVVTVCHSAAAP